MNEYNKLVGFLKYLEGVDFLESEIESFDSSKLLQIRVSAFNNANLAVLTRITNKILNMDYFKASTAIDIVSIIYYVDEDIYTFRKNLKTKDKDIEVYKNGNRIN